MNIVELHDDGWKRLCRRRAQLPHALLICGQRGIGKLDLARSFAASLLCEEPAASGLACGQCAACGWLRQGNHPDLRVLQPAAFAHGEDAGGDDEAGKKKASQQITIDQVRALDEFLHVGTHRHGVRVLLLNPAEAMNRSTANAVLKSLEEPLPGTLFLLISSEPHRLLPTIRSRCQALPLRPPAASTAVEWLRRAGVRDSEQCLALAGGSPLLALELSATSQRALLDALLAQLARGREVDALTAAAVMDKAVKAEKRPAALKRLLEWAQKWLFDLALASHGLPPRYFLEQAALLQRLARLSTGGTLLAFNRKALQYRAECEQPVNSRLFLEEFFLNYARIF